MRAVLQRADLRADRLAAAQGDHLDILLVAGQAPDFARHLGGQFARGTQNQGLGAKVPRIEPGEQRQRKRGRFAAAGLGLADQVHARQGLRQCRRLYGGHFQVAQTLQIGELGRRQGQAGERSIAHVAGRHRYARGAAV